MKNKEALIEAYFEDVKPDFDPSVRYGIAFYADDDERKIIDVGFKGNDYGNILSIYPDDLDRLDVDIDAPVFHTKDLKKLGWLLKRTAKLVNDLRKADKDWIGEAEDDLQK